jgi:hypothetical protein
MAKLNIGFSHFRSFLKRNQIFFTIVFGLIASLGVMYAIYHPDVKKSPYKEASQPQKQESNKPLTSAEVKHSPSPPLPHKVADHKNTETTPISSDAPKTQQINAPNSVMSIDQKGGVTTGTVINANTVNLAPQKRRISPEQLEILLPALKTLCATKVKIGYATGDEEQKQFAEDIINAFHVAGCNPEVVPPAVQVVSPYGKGLSFGVSINPPYPPGAAILQQALNKARIESNWYGFPAMSRDSLVVHVGERP